MGTKTGVDTYISSFHKNVQLRLEKMRTTIRKAAPAAEEVINYGIPTFTLNGNLVHYATYKNHIGFYPSPSGIEAYKEELSVYEGAKGSIKFPIEKPLPFSLITKIVKFRVKENLAKAEAKKPKDTFLSSLSAPARRVLQGKGIKTLKQLSKFAEKDILGLHGVGANSVLKLRSALQQEKLSFKK